MFEFNLEKTTVEASTGHNLDVDSKVVHRVNSMVTFLTLSLKIVMQSSTV